MDKNSVICLMGPTASGKTDLAMQLASHMPVELISVDSAMIYREMNIGTAKPSPEILKQFPHHLIDIINPDESYSAGRFVVEAQRLIASILQQGKTPLLVGGTMLYFHALQTGMSTLPEANQTLRATIEAQAMHIGWPAMHQKLTQIDPVSAAKIHPQDPQRISRALEVYEMTGQPLSVLQAQKPATLPYHWLNLILYPSSRVWLHEQIRLRFRLMLQLGLIEEVQGLLERWPACRDRPAMRSVGYRQVLSYLDGQLDKDNMEDKGVIATRQLAKRQCTWLKSWPDACWFDPQSPRLVEQVKEKIQ
jgi:tRNA dimethylallyltransferase